MKCFTELNCPSVFTNSCDKKQISLSPENKTNERVNSQITTQENKT